MNPETFSPEEQPGKPKLSEILTRARKTAGLSIEVLSQELKLQNSFLSSLEKGEYRNLPAEPYTRAFLITLSKRLNLDPDQIILQFIEEQTQVDNSPAAGTTVSGEPKPARFNKSPVAFISILTLILILCIVVLRKNRGERPDSQVTMPNSYSTGNQIPESIPGPEPEPAETLKKHANKDSSFSHINQKFAKAEPAPVLSNSSETVLKQARIKEAPQKKNNLKKTDTEKKISDRQHTIIILKSIVDSVWINVKRKGSRDANRLLLKDDIWKVTHSDTIFIKSGVISGVEYNLLGKKITPAKRKITVYNGKLIK